MCMFVGFFCGGGVCFVWFYFGWTLLDFRGVLVLLGYFCCWLGVFGSGLFFFGWLGWVVVFLTEQFQQQI